ncbi:metal ABC transporter substrate-binding protein [Thermoactinomyces mirandus]|uniref:Zinc ABC transporter substrate-binding protein n=1 Tax=Thermoactinomyces mirandus TaxID=2756294 RepID=A0A7W2AR86_9BACL|nr:metal ABC transporter substrate-binding protein [Thermoactinomyces mirandus]MBA4602077.1 zinc ABC transporter substrate-binding protein [Thermoactinomyces mirandus]
MKKWVKIATTAMLLTLLLLSGCSGNPSTGSKNPEGKLQVYTSIYPLYDFARKIGGPYVSVTNLIPPGADPHHFELLPRDMSKLSEADLLVYNGGGFEPWVERVNQMLDPDKTRIVNATESIMTDWGQVSRKASHNHGHGEEHQAEGTDPHVWLDPQLAKKQAVAIRNALVQLDAEHKDDYLKNYDQLASELDRLDQEFKQMVANAPKKEFAVSHASFAYLAKRYGLEQIALSGLSPSDEPSPQELEKIIEHVKKHDIDVILFETLVNNKMAKVVKKEVNAEALVLNPLEGLTEQEMKQGEDYFSVMRKNKENLAKALGVTNP